MAAHYRNSFRFQNQPTWLDFYNCRVMLPEQGVYFFAAPLVISGEQADPARRGLTLFDSGNGGPDRQPLVASEFVGTEFRASTSECDFHWSRPGDERDHFFTESRVQFAGPLTTWDIELEPCLTDRSDSEDDLRRFNLEERMLLSQVPLIHRVPRMKAYAYGVIEQAGCRYEIRRAPVYQAKNHGPQFPEQWYWIHANAFDDEQIAFEAASLTHQGKSAAMVRLAQPGQCKVLTSWGGDELEVHLVGRTFQIRACSADGKFRLQATAIHGDHVVFDFPSPCGGRFRVDECLTGAVTINVNGVENQTRMAAVGWAHHVAD